MRILKEVTLVAVATKEIEATVNALEYSANGLTFDKVLLIASYDPSGGTNSAYQFIQIPPFGSVGDWGRFIVFELHKYIETEFVLLVHADGFVVNPDKWNNNFLNYDYIGAPWALPRDNFSFRDFYGNIVRVGNSVSLRSKKLLKMPTEIGLEWDDFDHGFAHEDGFLCVQHRHSLQERGIKFAPLSVAVHFSREKTIPENRNIEPFAFHKWSAKNRDYPCFGHRPNWKDKALKALYKAIPGIKK